MSAVTNGVSTRPGTRLIYGLAWQAPLRTRLTSRLHPGLVEHIDFRTQFLNRCDLGSKFMAHLSHLNARDTTLAWASRAPQADIARLKARMGWEMPWYTITDSFDKDFGVDEWHGHNVFFRDGERVFRTYFINNRGDEAM